MTEMRELINSISTDAVDHKIASSILKLIEDHKYKNELALEARKVLRARLKKVQEELDVDYPFWYDLFKRTYLIRARDNFDDYLLYLEWDRPPEKQFYLPRRKILKVVVDQLQELEDDKFEILSVSLPPRTGKSTLGIFFLTWVMGRNPELPNLMSGHSAKLTDGFFRESLNIIQDADTYNWNHIFDSTVFRVNSKDEIIDLDEFKRFPSLTCRSVEGTLTGAVEAGNYLYCDDLVSDLEEALNPTRLQTKWDAYANQLKDRKKQGAKEIHIGTRWSVADPIGRLALLYEGDPRFREIIIPALDEDGKSNFNYLFGEGFNEAYYEDMRDTIDDATWSAKYLGVPYEREGLLFPADDLTYYNGNLPAVESLAKVYAFCDVAWGGGDYLSMPIIYEYEDGARYVADVVFNNGDRNVTQPIVAGKLMLHKPTVTEFEANNGGAEYAHNIDDLLISQGHNLNILHGNKPNTKAKLSRIIEESPAIRKTYYIEKGKRTPEYEQFMQNLTSFVQTGKVKNDDAPDSMSGAMKMRTTSQSKITFLGRF